MRLKIALQYTADECHHIVVNALEIPDRPAVLSIESEQIELIGSPGSEVVVRVPFGESGGQQPLEDVEVSLGDVASNGQVLPCLTDSPIGVGVVLPGMGTSVPFTLEVPWEAEASVYTGELEVVTSNAGSLTVTVNVDVSHAPGQPATPTGRASGFTGLPYPYTTHATDVEGEPIYYKFYWGDGKGSDWLGPFDSGANCSASHEWTEAGTYEVAAIAKDEYGRYSETSEPLVVTIEAPSTGPKSPAGVRFYVPPQIE